MQGVLARETPFRQVMKLAQSGSAGFAMVPDFEGAQGSAIDNLHIFALLGDIFITLYFYNDGYVILFCKSNKVIIRASHLLLLSK